MNIIAKFWTIKNFLTINSGLFSQKTLYKLYSSELSTKTLLKTLSVNFFVIIQRTFSTEDIMTQRTPQQFLDKTWNKETNTYEPIPKITGTTPSTATSTMAGTSVQSTVQMNLIDIFNAKAKTEDIDKDEYKLIDFVEFVIKNIVGEVNTDIWLDEAVRMVKSLQDHFKEENLTPCFNHFMADKFFMRRSGWEKELNKPTPIQDRTLFLSTFKAISTQDYTTSEEIHDIQVPEFCYIIVSRLSKTLSFLKTTQKLQATKDPIPTLPAPLDATQDQPIVKEPSNLITLNDSQSTAVSEIVGNNFKDRAKQQPTYQHYLTEKSKLGSLRAKFNSLAKLINAEIEEAANDPELIDLKEVANLVVDLTQQCQKLRSQRKLAIKYFDDETKSMDTYMDEIQEQYRTIKQDVITYLPDIIEHLPAKLNMPSPKLEQCAQCACPPMTPHNMRLHNLQHHGPLLQHTSTEAGSIQMGAPPPLNLGNQQHIQDSNGSYQTRTKNPAPTPTSSSVNDLEDQEELMEPAALAPPVQADNSMMWFMKQQQEHNEKMFLAQQKANFKIQSYVHTWNPNIVTQGQKFYQYHLWSLQIRSAKHRMMELQMSKNEMYVALISVLGGDAKDLVIKSNRLSGDFNLAMEILDKEFFNKHSFVTELSTQLELIPPMHARDATKMSQFYREVSAITEQLKDVLNDDASVIYTIETALYSKLNETAKRKWRALMLSNQNKASRVGHDLSTDQFLDCIETTRTEAKFDDDFRQRQKLAKKEADDKKEKEKEARKKKELEDQKKKESSMTDFYSYNTSTESQQYKDLTLGQKCDVPNCGQILSNKPYKHPKYISKCPQLKKNEPKVNVEWFKKSKRRCEHCLVRAHTTSECRFSDWTCKRTIIKNGQEEFCGKPHHFSLHDPTKHGAIVQKQQQKQQQQQQKQQQQQQ